MFKMVPFTKSLIVDIVKYSLIVAFIIVSINLYHSANKSTDYRGPMPMLRSSSFIREGMEGKVYNSDINELGSENYNLKKETAETNEDMVTSSKDTATPSEDINTLSEVTATPSENTTTPSDDTATPSKDTAAPSEDIATPIDNTATPSDGTVTQSEDEAPPGENTATPPSTVFQPPKKEKPERRFPQAVIIGFAKCGTRALIDFLKLHPNIKTPRPEMHFYDKEEKFKNGYDWYKSRMPVSYSNQITIEKTPAYVRTMRARSELKKKFPNVKIIALVRNPVVRFLSAYAQLNPKPPGDIKPEEIQKYIRVPGTSKIDGRKYAVNISRYYNFLEPWFRDFKRSQILVADGDELVRRPLSVVQDVEQFLGIPKLFSEENFVKNETTGFYCFKGFATDAKLKCFSHKGRPHVKLEPKDEKLLYEYYKPYNEKLYNLLNQTFDWSME